MGLRIQLGRCLLVAATVAAIAAPGYAQRAHFAAQHPPANKPAPRPRANNQPRPNQPKPNANRPPANANRPVNQAAVSGNRPNQNAKPGPTGNAGNAQRLTPREQLGVGSPKPWVDKMRDLSPAQRERVLQDSPAFQKMQLDQQNKIRNQFKQWDQKTPQQRADQREKEGVWRNMTPEQRQHIKNDVLPQWRQMSKDRQDAISKRLGILKNMPESAKNQRLNDPKFTEGMSDEDKATLRDLSHLHVGGPPDPPAE
jgi:hypothetical protein